MSVGWVVMLPIRMTRFRALRLVLHFLIGFQVACHGSWCSVNVDAFGPCTSSRYHRVIDRQCRKLVRRVLVISVKGDVKVLAGNSLFLASRLDHLALSARPIHLQFTPKPMLGITLVLNRMEAKRAAISFVFQLSAL